MRLEASSVHGQQGVANAPRGLKEEPKYLAIYRCRFGTPVANSQVMPQKWLKLTQKKRRLKQDYMRKWQVGKSKWNRKRKQQCWKLRELREQYQRRPVKINSQGQGSIKCCKPHTSVTLEQVSNNGQAIWSKLISISELTELWLSFLDSILMILIEYFWNKTDSSLSTQECCHSTRLAFLFITQKTPQKKNRKNFFTYCFTIYFLFILFIQHIAPFIS